MYTVGDLVRRLQQFDQDCKIEFLVGGVFGHYRADLGSVYDNTDPLYNRPEDLRDKPTLVTIELDREGSPLRLKP